MFVYTITDLLAAHKEAVSLGNESRAALLKHCIEHNDLEWGEDIRKYDAVESRIVLEKLRAPAGPTVYLSPETPAA